MRQANAMTDLSIDGRRQGVRIRDRVPPCSEIEKLGPAGVKLTLAPA
jgi:hypothetical protein